MSTTTDTTTHVFQVWIKATPEKIWEAITSREWSDKYGYKAPFEYDLRPGGAYRVVLERGRCRSSARPT